MGITVVWDNEEKTIIRQTYVGQWTWEEFDVTGQQVTTMLKSVSHRVDILSDMSASGALPPGLGVVHTRRVLQRHPANWGILVIVSANLFFKSLIGVFNRVAPDYLSRKTFAATTIDEAYQRIEAQANAEITSRN